MLFFEKFILYRKNKKAQYIKKQIDITSNHILNTNLLNVIFIILNKHQKAKK